MASPIPQATGDGRPVQVRPVDDILVLELDPGTAFEEIRDNIRELLAGEDALTRGKDARLDLATRNIDIFDLRRLVHLLQDECSITVTGIYCSEDALQRYAERELKLKIYARNQPAVEVDTASDEEAATADETQAETLPADSIEWEEEPDTETLEIEFSAPEPPIEEETQDGRAQQILTVNRSLRSGQLVRSSGDVAIYGDVHPGAEVIAGGNIMIFGTLMGMAHAGSRGDEGSIILALDFRPTQLRIGRKIGVPPEIRNSSSPRQWSPEIAWVEGGEVRVAPYSGQLPS